MCAACALREEDDVPLSRGFDLRAREKGKFDVNILRGLFGSHVYIYYIYVGIYTAFCFV